jgi:hypothetical protein
MEARMTDARKLDAKTFRRWCRELREIAPVLWRTTVRRSPIKDCGRIIIDLDDKVIRIYISTKQDYEASAASLCHEWAHARVWDMHRSPPEIHDGVFWIEHGDIYRRWYETA